MSRTVKVEQHGPLGALWFIGWLFSIGYLKLGFWQGLLALLIWPYFMGAHFSDAPAVPNAPPADQGETG